MARIKSRVVTARESPKALRATAPAVISNHSEQEMAPASTTSSSSATSSTCPHCKSKFSDLPPKDFQHHVASCTRTSTATDDDSSDSSLTPPPDSPSVANSHTITVDAKPMDGGLIPKVEPGTVNGLALHNVLTIREVDRPIRPYYNPDTQFEYYDKLDEREGSVATRRNSEEPEEQKSSQNGVSETASEEKAEVKIRHPFLKFTSMETFDDYLANPDEMSYEELYRRTDAVASVLVEYQKEWDCIEKEVNAHESYLKAEAKKAADAAKIAEEEKSKVEDRKSLDIYEAYRPQFRLSRSDWDKYLEELEAADPPNTDLIDRLRNLRLPNFLTALIKRQKAREPDTSIKLIDRPLMADRVTKEELALDKRKRGRLIDEITFDDMKHADVYGFNYSSQAHHVGNQPQPTLGGKTKGRGDANDEGRSRSQRSKYQQSYDADRSPTPESDSEELPAKRARKPRNLDAGIDYQQRTRTPVASRGGTPAVRTFPSGKRVGRPPAKSKLKDVQLAQSISPALDNGGEPRMLLPKEEEQLHDAAELLVKKTRRQSMGGESSQNTSRESTRYSSPSGSDRKKKRDSQNTDLETLIVESAPFHPLGDSSAPPAAPAPKSRKRKPKEEEIDESTLTEEAREALRKKRIKSAKLSESLRKRWEKGEMAGAMETRKATNAAKKAKKLQEKAAANGDTVLQPAPPVEAPRLPTPPPPAPPVQPVQPQPITPIETPIMKRKQSSSKKSSSKGKKPAPVPIVPPPRQLSTRARKPTRLAMNMDGVEDDEDDQEIEQQFKSEYDHFQALTSPGSPVVLGKRNRRSRVNLAEAMMNELDDEEEGYY
ncbi:hypothetical protein B0J14DRAFT_517694 [Halenospora varia]|nr:hypothetical protein B0J14DRAFT_517694 [Halenospora varia]